MRLVHVIASFLLPTTVATIAWLPIPSLGDDGTRTVEAAETRLVERVVDGDTLVLGGGERVRLIGVDTPETVHPTKPVERFGKEASAFTRRLAEGKLVRLESDAEGDARDRYGRTLAYVYLPDGLLLNLEIIERGYGFAYTRFPFARMEEFRSAEREARANGRGLWADGGGGTDARADDPSVRDEAPERGESTSGCTPRSECCRVCSKGQACGASCISRAKSCRKGRGCACDAVEVCR